MWQIEAERIQTEQNIEILKPSTRDLAKKFDDQ
ncbi:hypothetical protein M2350_003363 [Candidatus Fervidibacter sacchari]|uniref:Uncharacterized protein n=1 Tax=Candidatus Fervidibacter sacchari TaxID=1448929 RepID=A0ABT2ESN9_9BACT|nr:hypothetical protein [Candidatus Fervidibacter sacchari]